MKKIVIASIILSCLSCRTPDKQVISDLRRVNECEKRWLNDTIAESISITVILFDKRSYACAATYPALVIGVTIDNDTVAVADKNFEGELTGGQVVKLIHQEWTANDNLYLHPLLPAGRDRKRNDIYCQVKTLYKGTILL